MRLRRARGPKRPSRSAFVRQMLPTGGVGAEIGVQHGDFTGELLELTKPRRLHLFDLWYMLGPEWHWGEGERSTTAALIGVIRRFEDELVSGRVALNIGDDVEQLVTFPDRYFDWAYLDSSHLYEHTRNELELLSRKVKPDGVIAGDDWLVDTDHPHHGVCRAVSELVAGGGYELVYANERDLQWAISATGRPG